MSDKRKIMIIAHFCDYGKEQTNNRFNYLAEYLSKHGFSVELVTSSFSHRDKCQRQKSDDSEQLYKITLIQEPSYQKNISLKRLFVSHRVMAGNLKKYLQRASRPDLVYCAIPSIQVSEVAAQYAKENQIPFVVDVQDLWPEAYKLILKNENLYRIVTKTMKKRIDTVYAAADQIVSVSDTYTERVKSVNVKCDHPITVYLGTERVFFDSAVQKCIPKYSKADAEFWVGYCGTLGHSYDLTVVMEALKMLAESGTKNIRLIAIGSGPLEETFKQKALELEILCTFTGKLPYDQMCAQLNQCDIAVNPIVKGAAQSVINKHADYAIAGLPVVNTQECEEYCNLLKKYECGINCKPESVTQVAEAIYLLMKEKKMCDLMHQNALKMGEEKFERSKTYGNILREVQRILT